MDTTQRTVVLELPADFALLRVARVTVASVAAELPFTLQDLEDLRVAIDELIAAAIDGCPATTRVRIEITIDGDGLRVSGTVPGAGALPELHPVALDLLGFVAAGYQLGGDDSGRTFGFSKRPAVRAS